MSNKNVDKKKKGNDIKNQKQILSLVKGTSLLHDMTKSEVLETKSSMLPSNNSPAVGFALFKESTLTFVDRKNLANASIGIDYKGAQFVLYKPQDEIKMSELTINNSNISKMFFNNKNNFSFSQEAIAAVINKFKLMNEQPSSNKEKPLLLTDGRELKDSELKGGELAGLDDLFGLKNKSDKDFTDEDQCKLEIKKILVPAIKNVSDPSAISSLVSSLGSSEFLSQPGNSVVLAGIIAGIGEEHAHLYGLARNVHDLRDKDKEGYKREILRQKFVLSGLLDPKFRKTIHQSIGNEQLMLSFCKEANISYRSILFGFLPEELQTIENVYEIFADLKDESKDGNDNNDNKKDNKFERFVKATLERYRLGPGKNILEELEKLKSEGQINLEAVTDQLKEAIENGDKLGADITEVLEFLRDKLNSTKELKVPPAKTIVLLKTIWAKRRHYSLDENGLEIIFSILNNLIQDGMATSDVDVNGVLRFISDMLNPKDPKVIFNNKACEKMFVLINKILDNYGNDLMATSDANGVFRFISDMLNPKDPKVIFNNKACEKMFVLINKILDNYGNDLNSDKVDSALSALASAIKEKNITGLTTKQVLELINRVIESRLNSSVMADLFKALASVIENDGPIDSELLKDFFTLINNFAFKEQSTQGDPVRNSMLNALFELRQKFIKNRTNLVSKPDVVSILNQMVAFCEERKKNLVGDDILAIVQTLESMMLLGDSSQVDLNNYLSMSTGLWTAAQGMVSEQNNLSIIAQRMFGALLFAIKFGNKDNLANLKMKDVFQLYQNVLNALQGKTEAVIRPIFVALGYALENVKNVTTTQVYNLVKGSGILSDSNFQISIRTAQIIFSVLLAVLKIENRDESKVKSLFGAVNLDSIGLAFREGKIELLDESKAKDTISCYACINLFYTKLEEIFKEKIFKSETKQIKKEKPEKSELPKAKENAEQKSEEANYDAWFTKHSQPEVLITESADKNKNADVNQTNQTNAQPVPYSDWFERNKEKSKFGQKETNENESDKTNINNEMNKNDNLEKNLKVKSGNQENQTVEQVNNNQYATMIENMTVIKKKKPTLKNDQFKNDKEENIEDKVKKSKKEENKSTVENRLNDNIYKWNSNNGNEYVSQLSKQEKEKEDIKKKEDKEDEVKDNTQEKLNENDKEENIDKAKKSKEEENKSTVENRLNSSMDNIYRGNSNNENEYVSRLSKQEKEEEQNNNQNKNEQNDIINGNINKNEEENINNSNSDNNMGSKDNNYFDDLIDTPDCAKTNNHTKCLKASLEPIEEEAKEDQDIDDIQNNVNKEQNDDISVEIKNISSKNENTRENPQQIIFEELDTYFKKSKITAKSLDVHANKKDYNNARITKTKNEKALDKEAGQKNTRENPQQIIFKKLDAYFKKSEITAKSPRVYESCHANNQLRKKSEDPKNPQTIQKSLNKNNFILVTFILVTWMNNFWLALKNLFFEFIGRKDKITVGYFVSSQIDEQKNAENASVPNKPVTKILLRRPIMYNECEKLSKDNQDNVI